MKLKEIHKIIEPKIGEERNEKVLRQIAPVDEGFIYPFVRDILNISRTLNPIQNIDSVLESHTGDDVFASNNQKCNTWPFGNPTSEVYPRFLAICRGNVTLNKAFSMMSKQSRMIAQNYRHTRHKEKTVILLTDKWDIKTFKKYEKEYLSYAMHDGIWYIFLLVTEYGYTQIPFLPNDREILQGFENEKVEDDVTFEEMIDRLQGQPIEYNVTKGTWKANNSFPYCFCFWADLYGWHKESDEGICEGKVPYNALCKFLGDALWISETSTNAVISNISASDAPVSTLRIFGITVTWDVLDNCEERIIALQKSLGKFVDACEKWKR
ncbi:hypothetical protein [Selenomonas sp. FC4001]|uniref:hypothetical protein n=1 Tax=Selenomonas sp. FC4001 TaxID=1408313 RepID=UPI000564045E|nr:hypothetical protein [Selenomonas sp. FC4001]